MNIALITLTSIKNNAFLLKKSSKYLRVCGNSSNFALEIKIQRFQEIKNITKADVTSKGVRNDKVLKKISSMQSVLSSKRETHKNELVFHR